MLRDRIMWYCKAMYLDGPTEQELGDVLPKPQSAAGKALALAAVGLTAEKWVGQWGADAEAEMRYVVTIGRRASASCKWDRLTDKASNRLANCVNGELHAVQLLDQKIQAYSKMASG